MSTSSSRTRSSDGQFGGRSVPLPSVSRYDLVLALIPAVFLLTAVAAGLVGVPVSKALAVGATLALTAVVDALFLHPPADG